MGSEILILIGTLGGATIGAILAPFFNHKYRIKQLKEEHKYKLKYLREEIFFSKKLEYFERTMKRLDEKIEKYKSLLKALKKNSPNIEKQKEDIKKQKKDQIWIPMIFCYTPNIIEELTKFKQKETLIFKKQTEFLENLLEKKKVDKKKTIKTISNYIKQLEKIQFEMIMEMKKELK